MNQDLKIIKKKYGEAMMHLCRNLFPTILEKEGLLSELLLDHFAPSHELYVDLEGFYKLDDFKYYIYSLLEKKEKIITNIPKTPKELMEEAGYILYECKSEEEIQQFKKYYAPGETLCTFNGGRLYHCHVFFAVKKNVDEIKREDYPNPERQDEYGTSVISIQFTKDGTNTLSIKNRYNHKVANPDATFSNNLDNIVDNLTESFEYHYGLSQKYKHNNFELPNYVCFQEKYYKYNYELGNVYYCPNNIIIDYFDNKVIYYEKEKYIVFDTYILDLQNKKITIYEEENYREQLKEFYKEDAFIKTVEDIQNISIINNNEGKIIFITPSSGEVIELVLDKENNIISYKNNNVTKIEDDFLCYCKTIKKLELQNVKEIGYKFLYDNTSLSELYLPSLEVMNHFCLYNNRCLFSLSLPNVKSIGEFFLPYNHVMQEIYLSKLQVMATGFLWENPTLQKYDFSSLTNFDRACLTNNKNVDLNKIITENVQKKYQLVK